MTDATVSRIGQINATGDALAIFLKQFAGEVLTAYQTNVLMADKHMTRNINSGKSAQFPMTWKIGSGYHTPGAEIVGKVMEHAEKIITIDDLLISDAFIANIDEAMNHYEVRSVYTTEMGRELAKTYDKNVFRNVILAARASHEFDANYDGRNVTSAMNTGALIKAAFFAAAQGMDQTDVPAEDRYGVLDVPQYYLAAQETELMDNRWGGVGSLADANIPKIADIPVFKSNNVAKADDSANAALPTKYRANFSTTVGAIFHKGSAGTVKLMDMALESQYDIRRQGTLFVAKYAVGHGPLRTEGAYELKTA